MFTRTTICLAAALLTADAADWPQWRGPNRDGISSQAYQSPAKRRDESPSS